MNCGWTLWFWKPWTVLRGLTKSVFLFLFFYYYFLFYIYIYIYICFLYTYNHCWNFSTMVRCCQILSLHLHFFFFFFFFFFFSLSLSFFLSFFLSFCIFVVSTFLLFWSLLFFANESFYGLYEWKGEGGGVEGSREELAKNKLIYAKSTRLCSTIPPSPSIQTNH